MHGQVTCKKYSSQEFQITKVDILMISRNSLMTIHFIWAKVIHLIEELSFLILSNLTDVGPLAVIELEDATELIKMLKKVDVANY
jgi:hypothetical protein